MSVLGTQLHSTGFTTWQKILPTIGGNKKDEVHYISNYNKFLLFWNVFFQNNKSLNELGNPTLLLNFKDFFYYRLKKIQEKKKKIRAETELLNAKFKAEGLVAAKADNILDDEGDEDMLFK